ncbi:hypothetical protein ACGFYQ_35825 [Streptomyces sp. NPDC048258]|uniref:hypothetical protein n=1 Tax=Streptomyces sp. NPDC048258 TaxID=3365527 RepID=UPI00371B4F3F
MTHPFRKPRFLMLAASTAVVAGGVLVPTGAFAAVPTAPHAVVADDSVAATDDQGGTDNKSTLLLIVRDGDGNIRIGPGQGKDDSGDQVNPIGQGGPRIGEKNRHKGGPGSDTRVKQPKSDSWVCITAPCGPEDKAAPSG